MMHENVEELKKGITKEDQTGMERQARVVKRKGKVGQRKEKEYGKKKVD